MSSNYSGKWKYHRLRRQPAHRLLFFVLSNTSTHSFLIPLVSKAFMTAGVCEPCTIISMRESLGLLPIRGATLVELAQVFCSSSASACTATWYASTPETFVTALFPERVSRVI